MNPAIARLRIIDKPGAYLVRFKKEYIFSYICENGDIKHETINNRRNTSLRDANPEVISIQDTVDFLLNLDQNQKFVYFSPGFKSDLEFTELLNMFKHLVHLSLVVLRASDTQLKDYLVTSITQLSRAKEKVTAEL